MMADDAAALLDPARRLTLPRQVPEVQLGVAAPEHPGIDAGLEAGVRELFGDDGEDAIAEGDRLGPRRVGGLRGDRSGILLARRAAEEQERQSRQGKGTGTASAKGRHGAG